MKIHSKEARLRYLKWILKDIYGEERFEVSQTEGHEHAYAVVHFPHIKITNIIEQEHDIYDLFIRFKFVNTDFAFYLYNIRPARTTFNVKEILYDGGSIKFYIHSHLPYQYSIIDFVNDNFCLGNTEFAQFVSNLQNTNYIVKDLAMLFHSFNSYIQWESIEGRPYIYMNSLNYQIFSHKSIYDNYYIRGILLQETIKNMDSFSFRMEHGDVLISGITDIIKKAAKSCKVPKEYYARMLGGRPCTLRINPSIRKKIKTLNSSKALFMFKGNPVDIKINLPSTEEIRKTTPLELHPDIVNWVTSELEQYFLDYLTITYKN